jgi:predicted O-linked N-acetylglucosamine transferase (SPINDLY family)
LRLALADWSHFAEDCRRVRAAVDRADGRLDPAIVCLLPDFSAADQKRVAEAYARRLMAEAHVLSEPMPAKARQKLRLGYVSNDFADHPVGRHMVGILAHHDRSRFHVRGYALGRDDGSAIGRRLRESFDELVDLSTSSDRTAAERIRADEIDLLIDLGGFTEGSRPGIAVLRAAPIQALYLGISGTCGAPIFDYVITDRVVTPPELADRYGEKFAFLPGSLFNSDHTETGPLPSTDRQDHGLPPDGFVFCAFNNTAKITPQIFDVWMDLLHAVSDGVLWLRKYYAGSSANLRKAAEARGIAAERLIFAGVVPRPEHLGRMACADLGLDTFPYGAGSTASDMLWAGVPLLTCAGETYASRMAASQLHAVDLAELVATDIEDYRAKALSWATNRAQLRALRQRLAEARATSMLFDAARFTRALEQLYTELVGASPEVS